MIQPKHIRALLVEPHEVYHNNSILQAGSCMSSHALSLYRRNQRLFRKKMVGLIQDHDNPAYLVGRAAHCLILEGHDAFMRSYTDDSNAPMNPKTRKPFGSTSAKYLEWVGSQNKEILTINQWSLCESMADSVRQHSNATELLADGVAEGVVRPHGKKRYHGINCQARFDWVHPEYGIVDLKTCANLDRFEADAISYGYIHQLAFYWDIMRHITGDDLPVWLIAVEKIEPYRSGVWKIDHNAIIQATDENTSAIADFKVSMSNDIWLSGFEEPRVLKGENQ